MNLIKISFILLLSTISLGAAEDPVPPLQCTKAHEQWLDCGESCNRDYCQVPKYVKECESQCSPGCYCECGYYRDFNDNCVPQSQCPYFDNKGYGNICPPSPNPPLVCDKPHERYVQCGESCNRDLCQVPRYFAPCVSQCVEGCFCECGYYRNYAGNCVPQEKCESFDNFGYKSHCPKPEPPVTDCPPGQQWLDCGESCNRDLCRVPQYFAPCKSECAPGCYCECGTYKDYDGNCVPQDKCPNGFDNFGYDSICPKPPVTEPPQPDCPGVCGGPNELFVECGSFCGGNCRDFRLPINYLCIQGCKVGCVCAAGYYRHPITAECVLGSLCPTTDEYDYENDVPIVTTTTVKPTTKVCDVSSESSESSEECGCKKHKKRVKVIEIILKNKDCKKSRSITHK